MCHIAVAALEFLDNSFILTDSGLSLTILNRIVASIKPLLMPFPDVIVEARDDEGACLVIFGVGGCAARKDVGSMTRGYVLSHVEICIDGGGQCNHPGGVFGSIGIGDENSHSGRRPSMRTRWDLDRGVVE